MESFFAVQLLLAIALLGTFCAIMLFLIILLPYCMTNKTRQKFDQQDNEMVCDSQSDNGWTMV